MNFARSLIRDLVDKRLWPIAIVLVAALVAVPLMLGGGGESPADGAGPPALAPTDRSGKKVAAVELAGPPSVRSRPGEMRNPFRRSPAEATADTPTGASAGPPAQTPAAGGAATPPTTTTTPSEGDGSTAQPPTNGAGDESTEDAAVSTSYHRTEIRFGKNPGAAHAISRLTPLPGSERPALIYLGVSTKGATFLLGSGTTATASGDGDCVDARCRIIALEQGESLIVDAAPGEGEARRFALEVTSIDEVDASAGYAEEMHGRVHPEGRAVLRAMLRDATTATAIGAVRYDIQTGLLVRTASKPGTVTK